MDGPFDAESPSGGRVVYQTRKVEFYDRRGGLLKTLTFEDYREYEGRLLARLYSQDAQPPDRQEHRPGLR